MQIKMPLATTIQTNGVAKTLGASMIRQTQPETKNAIMLENVQKIYTSRKSGLTYVALKEISFKIKAGELVAIMGPSGSGKTTILDLIGTLDSPTAGRVIINGFDTSQMKGNQLAELRNTTIGFVFQSYNLVPYLSAMENVMLPARVLGKSGTETITRAKSMLAEVGLGDKVDKKPTELSGGEQQRVAIVRALVNSPEILLCDEPTGNLDTKSAYVVLSILKRINKEEGTTVVLSTHDPEVGAFAARQIHIRDGLIDKDFNNKDIQNMSLNAFRERKGEKNE